jgi:hypothetical protein
MVMGFAMTDEADAATFVVFILFRPGQFPRARKPLIFLHFISFSRLSRPVLFG